MNLSSERWNNYMRGRGWLPCGYNTWVDKTESYYLTYATNNCIGLGYKPLTFKGFSKYGIIKKWTSFEEFTKVIQYIIYDPAKYEVAKDYYDSITALEKLE